MRDEMARPKVGDPAAKAKILEAAESLFAERGFAGTAIRDIAARAGVNGAMVHYYFGNKEGLYQAVLGTVGSTISDAFAEIASGQGSTRERLTRLVEAYASYVLSHPHFARILYREMLASGDQLKQMARKYATANYTMLRDAIAEGVRRGELRPLDVDLAPVSLLGMVAVFQFLRPIVSTVLGKKNYDEQFIKRIAQHTVDLFLSGAQALPDTETRKSAARSTGKKAGRRKQVKR